MAGDGGLNALSLLPENVLPQWQQKIALRAENSPRPYHFISGAGGFFAHLRNFLQVLDLHIFRQSSKCSLVCIRRRGPIHGDGLSRK